MKRLLFAVALAVVATEARADGWGTPPVPPQAGAQMAGGGQGAYGVNPILHKFMWWKKDGCSTCGHGGHGAGGPVGPAGTLVYPQHQFARSPRDWFMYGN